MLRTDVPEVFSSITSLGEPIRIFKQSTGSKIGNILLLLFFMASGTLFIYFGLHNYLAPNGVASTNSSIIEIVIGLLLFLIFFYLLWKSLSKWGEAIVVYRDGFAYTEGDETIPTPWRDITSFTMRVIQIRYYGFIPAGTVREYKIETRSGKKIKLDSNLSRIEELITLIREQITPLQLEQYNQALDKGLIIQFGPVTVSRELGIQVRGDICPWAEIENITVANGEIFIRANKKGNFRGAHFSVHQVPNVDAFMIITSNLLQQNKGQSAININFKSQPPFVGI
jgi:Family of unknown function (DUF6585)